MPMPPKKKEINTDEWMNTYGDCVTLLLCFFVMLLAASKMDTVMFEQIRTGMSREFMDRPVDKPIALLRADLDDDLRALEMESVAALGSDHIGLILDLEADTFFDNGSAVLKAAAIPVLRRLVSTLNAPRYKIFRFEVQGHTDDNPINTPQFPSNWELSSARASAVTRFLIQNGIDPTRLRAVGLADIQPRYPNRDANGEPIAHNQRRNRRVRLRMDPVYK
ncbi:MAG: flagellar motor protein MotB [Alphaproteobacteria bacterium]|nr:flagellar motor protein MotB [Alphaproteobacteria bacterium]MBQ8346827.1 flagellar motor protein MotB [Alphaproteobacteria bacterium]